MTCELVKIADCVTKVKMWNPNIEASDSVITYIDIAAVDKDLKQIIQPNILLGADTPSRARQIIQTDDVLVSTVRPNLNSVALVSNEYSGSTASTGYTVLRPNPEILDSHYLFHWVKNKSFIDEMVRLATGQSYPAVSDKIIGNSKIPLPRLEEQRRIAAILDKADELRQKRQQAIERLDELLQAAFIDMFGDPVSNPKGWTIGTLGDVIHSAKDGPHVSPKYSNEGIPFLSTRHVRAGKIIWEDLKYLSEEEAQVQWKKCKPVRGDILYTKGGTTGLAAFVDTDIDFAVWVHVALLKPDTRKVRAEWLVSMLNSQFCYEQSQRYTHGIANRDLGLKRMVNITIYIPPIEEQDRFLRFQRKLIQNKILFKTNQFSLDILFQSLQNQAFNGTL